MKEIGSQPALAPIRFQIVTRSLQQRLLYQRQLSGRNGVRPEGHQIVSTEIKSSPDKV